MMKLPRGFVLGAATAAYQCEGATHTDGKGEVPWDDLLQKQGRFNPEPACDFYHKYPQDLELCKKFGIRAIRVSIAWSRIFPEGSGRIEPRGVAHYHHLFDKCAELSIEPYVTLHHFDMPTALFEYGGWLNPKNIDYFVKYAKFCFKEFGDQVHKWITINEPVSVAVNQYITGTFPPQEHFDFSKAFQCEHNFNLAHARAVNLFKEMKCKGEIGIIHALQTVYPASDSSEDQHAAALQDALDNRFLLDGTLAGKYSDHTLKLIHEIIEKNGGTGPLIKESDIHELSQAASQLDFLGINYYFSKFVKMFSGENKIFHNGTGMKGTSISCLKGVGEIVHKKGIPTTDWDWPIYPKGIYDMIMRITKSYPKLKKVYITENGLGYKDRLNEDKTVNDQPRIDYIDQHLREIAKAINDGAKVCGYFVWSLQDMFSWTNGYNKRYGLLYVDFKTQKRYPKKSAYWFKQLSKTVGSHY
ncbi:MAG: 6-phospho-beta-galactosidase [Sporolactobacillus sp.]|nr:6-phospho-beta-galactosidase [Sporolactobacillus sp.]